MAWKPRTDVLYERPNFEAGHPCSKARAENAGIDVNIAFSRFDIFHIAGRMDFPIDVSHFTLGAVYSWGGTSGRSPESESAAGERGTGNDRKG